MHAQGLGNAGSEAVGLNQGCYQGANVIDASAVGQIAERLDSRFAGARFEVEEMEFSAQFRVGVAEVLAHSHHGLIERQACFHADDGQIERVGKAEANPALAFLQLLLEYESREEKTEGG